MVNVNLARNLGVCLVLLSLSACASDLKIDGVSAQDSFQDKQVVSLVSAALDEDKQQAALLVKDGADVNRLGKDGATPLLWVMLKQNIGAMKILLDLGADPNEYAPGQIGVASSFGPPIWLAAGAGRTEMLVPLLERGGNSNQVFGGRSALMMALEGSHLDCAGLLLDHGADINWSQGSESAFFETMLHDQYDDALWLLNHGYTHDLPMARRLIITTEPRAGQEQAKAKALAIVDRLIAQQHQQRQ